MLSPHIHAFFAGLESDSSWLVESAPGLDSIFLTPIAAKSATLPLVGHGGRNNNWRHTQILQCLQTARRPGWFMNTRTTLRLHASAYMESVEKKNGILKIQANKFQNNFIRYVPNIILLALCSLGILETAGKRKTLGRSTFIDRSFPQRHNPILWSCELDIFFSSRLLPVWPTFFCRSFLRLHGHTFWLKSWS